MRRKILWLVFSIALGVLITLLVIPFRSKLVRLAILGTGLIIWTCALFLAWPRFPTRLVMLIASGCAAVFIVLPGRALDHSRLRDYYLQQLRRYDHTGYVYGGENPRGIDCSGLVRAGMIEALARLGLETANPHALRESLRLWWNDSNAIDLGKARAGLTLPIGNADYRRLADNPGISAGDLAVTESGSHVLAYLGQDAWIEAEPNVGGTHVFDLSGQFHYLADERVRFVRWKWFAGTD